MQDLRMARSGRKHAVTGTRVLEALQNAGAPTIAGDKLVYVGSDARGTELEIVMIEDPTQRARFCVIHAMPTEWRK